MKLHALFGSLSSVKTSNTLPGIYVVTLAVISSSNWEFGYRCFAKIETRLPFTQAASGHPVSATVRPPVR